VEYARLHWHLHTSSRADSTEGWWCVRVEPATGAHPPSPLLSRVPPGSSALLLPALGSQPRLCFSGVRGGGDEVYELIGSEGLLGVRPGIRDGEVLAFVDRGATAAAVFRRLTGLAACTDPAPVRAGGSAWGAPSGSSGLRVTLEQTLGSSKAPPTPQPGAESKPCATSARTERPVTASKVEEAVPDSWEEAFD